MYFQDQSAYSAAGKYVDRFWEYINRSQTHECGNWEWGRAIPRKGIHRWDFPCSVQYTPTTLFQNKFVPTFLRWQQWALHVASLLLQCRAADQLLSDSGQHTEPTRHTFPSHNRNSQFSFIKLVFSKTDLGPFFWTNFSTPRTLQNVWCCICL